MPHIPDRTHDVLIVGAGPTGLMMACQLAIHKISFRIIDKNEFPSNNSGALILQARSLEIFEKMGIAGEAISGGIIADKVNILYNGKKTFEANIKDIGKCLSKFPFLLMLEQSKTEKLLLKFISQHGNCVERGITFKSFIQHGEEIISLITLTDRSEQSIKTKYIIAADGGVSTVRSYLNIPFTGKTYPDPIFILDCKAKSDLVNGEIYFSFSETSVAGFFPLKDSGWRIDSTLPQEIRSVKTFTTDNIGTGFHKWTMIDITFQSFDWFSVTRAHHKHSKAIR